MKKIIFGITDLAEVLFYELNREGIDIDAFCVNEKYLKATQHMGKPVLAYEQLRSYYNTNEEIGIYLCIGYNKMNERRKVLFGEMKDVGYKILSFVHSTALVMADKIGEGCLIFEQAVIGPYTKIGDANIFYPKSMIAHHSMVGNYNFFAISCSVAGHVTVKNNCFIGNNASTKDGICIDDYTLVGAGAYLTIDSKPYQCIVPARSEVLDNHKSIDFL